LLFALPKRPTFFLEKPCLFTQTDGFSLGIERLFTRLYSLIEEPLFLGLELLLFLFETVVFGLGTGQVALPSEPVALLATLVTRREHAEKTLRRIGSIKTYGKKSLGKDAIGFQVATKSTRGSPVASRHDILRK
jgi:hypothetical protein